MAILHDPILIGDGDDRVVKVHCGTPGEQCNVDEATYKQKVPWNTAFMAIILDEGVMKNVSGRALYREEFG